MSELTVTVPTWLPVEPEPEVQPDAVAVLSEVRAAAASVQDVAEWSRAHGAPPGFTGDAAEAADHAVTRFATDTDVVEAALERGALAIDAFLTAMERRRSEHVDLMERRGRINQDREALIARIEGSTADDLPALRAQADQLMARAQRYETDLQAWRDRITADEDTCVRALQAVDQLAEGVAAAGDPGRADTAALASQLRQLGADTDAVNAWWSGLSEAERNALLISHPDLVGNTNGIPTGDRDEGNRASVERDVAYLEGLRESGQDLTPEQERWLENATSVQAAVAQASAPPYASLDVEALVMAYQPHAFGGDGIAAVAYGDPDTADHTAVYVPGIMQDGTRIDENGLEALALYDQATLDGASVSTIAWIGYDSPNWNPDGSLLGHPESGLDVAHTITEANAEAGGHSLSAFVEGLNSTHATGDQPHLTVIGHSYGSTTSAHAAADGMAADTLVLIGSPGAGGGVDHVSGLNMPEGQVFVGSAAHDPVTWLGGRDGIFPGTWDDGLGLGEDPSQQDFGAHNFPVDDGRPFQGPGGLVETGFLDNHVGYFEQGNPALDNMAQIVTGNGAEVADTGGRTQDAHDLLYDWAGNEIQREAQEIHDQYVQPVVDEVVETAGEIRDGGVSTYEGVRDGLRDLSDRGRDLWDDVWPDRWP